MDYWFESVLLLPVAGIDDICIGWVTMQELDQYGGCFLIDYRPDYRRSWNVGQC